MKEDDKYLFTRAEDRISFLYIDKARIEQTEYGVCVLKGKDAIEIPITTINCLILGPGVSITHRAVCNIASAGTSICFMGMDMGVFYTYGEPSTNRSKNLLKQIRLHENKALHLNVIHKMYDIRYPSSHLKSKSVEELRGIEGLKMREAYEAAAKEYDINWNGREYKSGDFDGQSVVNQYLTALNHVLYAVTQAVIVSLGFSPAIGFIHTGHIQSLVFDIADLYKERYIIPLAFRLAKDGFYSRNTLMREFRSLIVDNRLLQDIVKTIISIFDIEEDDVSIEAELMLWGDKNFGIFGKNYATEP